MQSHTPGQKPLMWLLSMAVDASQPVCYLVSPTSLTQQSLREGLESTQQAFCEDALKKGRDSQVSFKCTWPGFISVMVMKIS